MPGETVLMRPLEDPTTHDVDTLTAVADSSGSFTNDDYAPEQHDLGVTYTLVATDATTTMQHMEGDLRVNYPVVGRLAERGIVLGLKEHVAQEARIIERWVAGERL